MFLAFSLEYLFARTWQYSWQNGGFMGVTIFNSLPPVVRQAPTIDAFEVRLKTHYFALAYN